MILVKTEAGQQVFKDRSVRLTPRQRSAFILCVGKRSIDDVLAAGMGIGQEDLDQMLELGLLGQVAEAAGTAANAASVALPEEPAPALVVPAAAGAAALAPPQAAGPAAARTPQQRYQEAYPIATRLAAGLGLRGFRLTLAVEAAGSYEQLAALAPKLRAAVGDEKTAALDQALAG